MSRIVDFTMEREGLVKPGDEVFLDESVLKTLSGNLYYYTIKDAVAMSDDLETPVEPADGELKGKVISVTEDEGLFLVKVDCG
ncbi:MAG: hypothetical protein IJM62_02450 [Lachnospiraceae bacterium]|nr:hypothetical protein [Lachnospiraceae bacterium]